MLNANLMGRFKGGNIPPPILNQKAHWPSGSLTLSVFNNVDLQTKYEVAMFLSRISLPDVIFN